MAVSITSLTDVNGISGLGNVLSGSKTGNKSSEGLTSFDSLLESAKGLLRETEDYTNAAEDAELSYMLGLNDSVSDLLVAQTKANISLQYTVAIRNAVVQAYKEIMQLQF